MIVADAFDAMTTNRIYKARKTVPEALDELVALKKKQFHPEVIDSAIIALKDVTIDENINVSQPNALSNGQTAATPESAVKVKEEKNRMFAFKTGVSLDDLVNAVNQVGAAPSDLVAILEALKAAGALHAELIII